MIVINRVEFNTSLKRKHNANRCASFQNATIWLSLSNYLLMRVSRTNFQFEIYQELLLKVNSREIGLEGKMVFGGHFLYTLWIWMPNAYPKHCTN